MSAKKTKNTKNFETPAKTIRDVDIVDEIEDMFIPFAHYTIADRAIPNVLDGLKPSQRRILWAMKKAGFTSKKPFVKSTRVCGEVIASWHPHGDASVYSTMSNMVRPYVMNVPLVDPKGSFGFVAGDTASAARYTEARLMPVSDTFMTDIRYNAVDMQPNFDERLEEPVVLPVTFPVLVVNGASGIAVGFATNIAPHNPSEIIQATIHRIKHPKMTIDELLEIVPGPDFPTGCDIIGTDGIREAYKTGKGKIKIKAKYHIKKEKRRTVIEFYEIPYGVSPENIIDDINKLRDNDTVTGITDVMNLMDKSNPVRIAVYVKNGFDPQKIANQLITNSKNLCSTFAINQVALFNNVPRQFPMLDMLDTFIDFRRNIITRRTKAQINEIENKKQLQEALAKVLVDIDKVINIVRDSNTNQQVYKTLMKEFDITMEQAQYIGDMKLINLKKKDKLSVEKAIKEYEKQLKNLNKIIKNQKNLDQQVIKELEETEKTLARPRKTKILKKTLEEYEKTQKKENNKNNNSSTPNNDYMVKGKCNIYLTSNGQVCQNKTNEKGKQTSPIKKQKGLTQQNIIQNIDYHDTIMLVLEDGTSLRMKAYELPEKPSIMTRKCVSIIPFGTNHECKDEKICLVSNNGRVKILDCNTLTKNQECSIMNIENKDKILYAAKLTDTSRFVFITENAQLLTFNANIVNAQGRTSAGVAGIKLDDNDNILTAAIVNENDNVEIITGTNKTLKMTPLKEYPTKGRGSKGVRCHKMLKGENKLKTGYIGTNITLLEEGTLNKIDKPLKKRDASGDKLTTKNNILAWFD